MSKFEETHLHKALVKRLEWAWEQGSLAAGEDPAHWNQFAQIAIRRWHSFPRRLKKRKKPGDDAIDRRIEDLARGLRDRFEEEPALVGPMMVDYRWLATQLAAILSTEGG